MLDWAVVNRVALAEHELFATGTTGRLVSEALELPVTCFPPVPSGDQQVGAGIAEGRLDCVVFFWDPLEPQPHDVDVKALLRIAVVYDCPIACTARPPTSSSRAPTCARRTSGDRARGDRELIALRRSDAGDADRAADTRTTEPAITTGFFARYCWW